MEQLLLTGTVAWRIVLLPHSKKVSASNPSWTDGACMLSPYLLGLFWGLQFP